MPAYVAVAMLTNAGEKAIMSALRKSRMDEGLNALFNSENIDLYG